MIAHVTIHDDASVTVSCDSDGDQGDTYSTEVLGDLLTRASKEALTVWVAARKQAGE